MTFFSARRWECHASATSFVLSATPTAHVDTEIQDGEAAWSMDLQTVPGRLAAQSAKVDSIAFYPARESEEAANGGTDGGLAAAVGVTGATTHNLV